jgi:hypothetical protein
VQWDGFPAFWAQTVRWTISQDRDSNVETVVSYTDEQATLTVDARGSSGDFLNNLTMEANVVAPDGSVQNVTLAQVAPGRYETEFAPETDGAYFIRVAGSDGTEENVVGQTSGWVLGYSPEYRDFETNPQLLENIAALTGGQDLAGLETAVFDHTLPSEATTRPIWPWLTLLAVLLLPVDIAVRRLVITKRDWERAWAATFGRLQPATATPAPRTEQVSRLFEAKQRAEKSTSGSGETAVAPLASQSPPIQAEKEVERKRPFPTPPSTTSENPPNPADTSTLAARLLKKKQQQDEEM